MKNISEKFCELYKLLRDCPTGALKQDFTDVTMKDQFNDSFIRTIAKYLAAKNCEVVDNASE